MVGDGSPDVAPDGSILRDEPEQSKPSLGERKPDSSGSSWRSALTFGVVALLLIGSTAGVLVYFGGVDPGEIERVGVNGSDDSNGDDGVVTGETVVYEDGLIGGNDDVNEVVAHDNGTLELVFKDQNQADGFVLMHAYHDDPSEDSIVRGQTPAFGESVFFDFVGAIEGETYPNNEFAIEFRAGDYCEVEEPCGWTYISEKYDRIEFEVPEEFLEPEFGDEADDDGNTTIGM